MTFFHLSGNLLHNSVGRVPGPEHYDDYTIEASGGGVFVMITDGLTEDHVVGGDAYGYRFLKVIEACRSEDSARTIGEAILNDWKAHARDEDVGDDVSVVVVSMDPKGHLAFTRTKNQMSTQD